MEILDIIQEVVTKTILKKKKCKKAKWLSDEVLQIPEKRREAKAREKYIQLDSEYQRISRRDKKAFRSDEHKEIEENNRMGKTRDLFKKTGDVKGIFYERMGMIKDRNGKDLREAEEITKRWQEYTEELYKTDLEDLDNHNGVVTHLEPDILECEVKQALGSITMNKASGADRIPAAPFKMMLLKCCTLCQQVCKIH